jgi:hypothetical protein
MRPPMPMDRPCAFPALLQHEPGHGIVGKLFQDGAIGALRRGEIASLKILRSSPGHRAELLVPIADA